MEQTIEEIYQKLNASGMSEWVGYGDPRTIGDITKRTIDRSIDLSKLKTILDFGCGVGRTVIPLASQYPSLSITGVDIVPGMTSFCREAIAGAFPNTDFECLDASNPAYDRMKSDTGLGVAGEADFFATRSYDAIYSFSVFTHLLVDAWRRYLGYFRSSLKSGGMLVVSVFLLDPLAERAIARGGVRLSPTFTLDPTLPPEGFYLGNPLHPTVFVGVRLTEAIALLEAAGFAIKDIHFGFWREARRLPTASFDGMMQDVIVAYPV